jgi:hypothetical protein
MRDSEDGTRGSRPRGLPAHPVHLVRISGLFRLLGSLGPSGPHILVRLVLAHVPGRSREPRAIAVRRAPPWHVTRTAWCGGPDHPGEQFVRTDQRNRGPGRGCGTDQAVGPALGHVHGERGRDAESEHPAGQRRHRQPAPRRMQDDHRGRRTPGRRSCRAPAGRSRRSRRTGGSRRRHASRRCRPRFPPRRARRPLWTRGSRCPSCYLRRAGSGVQGPGRRAQRAGAGLARFKSRHAASSTRAKRGRAARGACVPAPRQGRDAYSVAVRARSRTPAVVPTYMSSVMR